MAIAAVTADLEDAPAFALPDWRKLAIFLAMAVGQFMALLDIQIVVASMSSIQAGPLGQPRRDRLDPDRLPDGRDRDDPAVGLSGAGALDALGVRRLGGAVHADQPVLRRGLGPPSMMVFRAIQGFVGGAMIPLAFSTGFTFFDGPRRARWRRRSWA